MTPVPDPSALIANQISELHDWRGAMMTRLRAAIRGAHPEINEDWKWETAVFTSGGKNVCALGVFKDHVKINFFKGASLADPKRLFNAGLDAKASRAIDVHEDEQLSEPALKDLVRAAVAANA